MLRIDKKFVIVNDRTVDTMILQKASEIISVVCFLNKKVNILVCRHDLIENHSVILSAQYYVTAYSLLIEKRAK